MARAVAVRGPVCAEVLARFALVWSTGSERIGDGWVGAFTLRPEQQRAVSLVRAAFTEFGGALLADPPGTGKTIIALAVAAGFDTTHVVAPAALRDQWERAARRAGVGIRFTSLEAMSRRDSTIRATLVIVDEAHHARSPATRRYAALAATCAGARVLLLSATPVVNRSADRDALLALFLGARAATLNAESAARCIIRRTDDGGARPRVRHLPPLDASVACNAPEIADALQRLPPPLPAVDGSAATALIRISLAMAWSSSLAALDAALRRRTQRGAALADALAAGRWPSHASLRQWVVGDDATQLAFPELEPAVDHVPEEAAALLRDHLRAIRSLREIVTPRVHADTAARADAIRALARTQPGIRMVVFARQADTIRALWQAMRADAGVVAITGSSVKAAHGHWRRADVLEMLGPRATPLRADDPRAIWLLLTTDLLAEGVELQGVGILVHADRPWTPARLEQRQGRIARIGGPCAGPCPGPCANPCAGPCAGPCATREVRVTRFRSPAAAVPLLRLGARLARKQRLRAQAVSDAEAWSEVELAMRAWQRGAAARTPRMSPRMSPLMALPASRDAFLTLLRIDGSLRLLAGWPQRGRWRVTTSPRAIARVVAIVARASRLCSPDARQCQPAEDVTRAIRTALSRWARRVRAREMVGPARDGRSRLQCLLRERLDRILQATPSSARAERGVALDALIRAISSAAGAGIESQLGRLLRATQSDDQLESGLRDLARAVRGIPERMRGDASAPRLRALLVLTAIGGDCPVEPPIATPASVSPPEAPARDPTSTSP